jgi:hypothetical protein
VLAGIGGSTSSEKNGPAKLQHLSAQAAMDVQSLIARSHGLPWSGQQSCIGSETDISMGAVGLTLSAALAAVGSKATEIAIRRANMVRARAMVRAKYRSAADGWSSDDSATVLLCCNFHPELTLSSYFSAATCARPATMPGARS